MRASALALVGTVFAALVIPLVAAAQSDGDELVPPPTELSGRFTCATYWQEGSKQNVLLGPMGEGNLVRRETRGFMGRYTVDAISDPRFDGVHSHYQDIDEYVGPATMMPDRLVLVSSVLRIENDEGAWQASDAQFYLPGTWAAEAEPAWEPTVLVDEGAYAGLTALLETRTIDQDCYCWSFAAGEPERCSWELRGVVFAGGMPPIPTVADE